jgi:protein SCO1/2
MDPTRCSRRDALALLLGACALATTARGTPLPASSIFQLDVPLTDQDGRVFRLPELRGEPRLVSMFYSSCEMVCPMIFETIKLTLAKAGAQPRVKVLMVSFDPARDSVAVLKKTAAAHGVDERWTLARGDDAATRKIAAVLGVQYRRLASGEFNHSSVILLLDGEGRISARSSVLGSVDVKLLQAIQKIAPATPWRAPSGEEHLKP